MWLHRQTRQRDPPIHDLSGGLPAQVSVGLPSGQHPAEPRHLPDALCQGAMGVGSPTPPPDSGARKEAGAAAVANSFEPPTRL